MKVWLKTIIIIAIALVAGKHLIDNADHDDVFDSMFDMFIYAFVAAIVIWIILSDCFAVKKSRNPFQLLPTGVIIIAATVLILINGRLKHRDASPVILHCVTRITHFNGIAIDFRADSTYKIINWCMGADYYRGRFSLKDSIIRLYDLNKESGLQSPFLVIRQDGPLDSSGIREKSIYQTDSNHHIIPLATDFRITP